MANNLNQHHLSSSSSRNSNNPGMSSHHYNSHYNSKSRGLSVKEMGGGDGRPGTFGDLDMSCDNMGLKHSKHHQNQIGLGIHHGSSSSQYHGHHHREMSEGSMRKVRDGNNEERNYGRLKGIEGQDMRYNSRSTSFFSYSYFFLF